MSKPDFRDVFSVDAVKERYLKIGHYPVRMVYGHYSDEPHSCLLGSFEHALGIIDEESSIDSTTNVSDCSGLPHSVIAALECGWEGWDLDVLNRYAIKHVTDDDNLLEEVIAAYEWGLSLGITFIGSLPKEGTHPVDAPGPLPTHV